MVVLEEEAKEDFVDSSFLLSSSFRQLDEDDEEALVKDELDGLVEVDSFFDEEEWWVPGKIKGYYFFGVLRSAVKELGKGSDYAETEKKSFGDRFLQTRTVRVWPF